MNNRERIVIYGLLAALVAGNVSVMMGVTSTAALAGPAATAVRGDAPPAVPAVTLEGEVDTGDLVLRNREGRLAWGESAHDRAYSVGYVFIGKVLPQLMRSEELQEDRDRLIAELTEIAQDYQERLDELRGRVEGMKGESEDAQALYQEWQALYKEHAAWQQQAMGRRGRLEAEHLELVYREMIEAVEVVADRKDIDLVYRFIPPGEAFNAQAPEQAMMAIRLRTILRSPDELDLTVEVLEELSLEIE